jgi:ADP-heptose:LPS heptosyltransferase
MTPPKHDSTEPLRIKGTEVRTIAVLRALHLGDLLCAVPALRALRAAFPDSHIALIGLPWAHAFVSRYAAYVDELIEFPGFPGLPERPVAPDAVPPFLSAMQQRRFDLVVQLHGSGHYTNEIAMLCGAGMTAGFFQPPEYCPDRELFLPYPDNLPEPLRHLELLRYLGIPSQGEDIDFPLTEADHAAFARLREAASLAPNTFVCIHPGGRGERRRWAPHHFAAVADRLAREGYDIVVTGTAEERDIVQAMLTTMHCSAVDLTSRTDLGALAVLLSRARLLLANDTGVSHMASALGIPSVIICIGSDPSRWSPLDRHRHRVLSGDMANVDAVLQELRDVLNAGDRPVAVTLGHSHVALPIDNSEAIVTRNHQYVSGI